MRIAPVTAADAPAVHQTLEEAHRLSPVPVGPRWSLAQTEAECALGQGWVGRGDAGELISFVLFRDLGDALEVSYLATSAAAQGRGSMRLLLRHMIDKKPSDVAVWLEVHEANVRARRLYEQCGFQVVGRRPGYYADGGAAVLYNYG